MSALRVRFEFQNLRAKITALREYFDGQALPAALERAGEQLVRDLAKDDARAASAIREAVLAELKPVFVPVTLKHQRREQWPDLASIHAARVSRRQVRYQGRRVFYVDEAKFWQLVNRLVARRLARLKARGQAGAAVRVLRAQRGWRLEIRVRLRGGAREEFIRLGHEYVVEWGERALLEAIRRVGF